MVGMENLNLKKAFSLSPRFSLGDPSSSWSSEPNDAFPQTESQLKAPFHINFDGSNDEKSSTVPLQR